MPILPARNRFCSVTGSGRVIRYRNRTDIHIYPGTGLSFRDGGTGRDLTMSGFVVNADEVEHKYLGHKTYRAGDKMKNITERLAAFSLMAAMFLIGLPVDAEAASPGRLDTSFSGDGKVSTSVAGDDDANDVVVQPDGKIVVVGRTDLGGGGAAFDFFVVRYNTNGTLDTTFGTGGIVTTDFGNIDSVQSVALQADGKIVVAGATDPVGAVTSDFAVARYNANGSLDTTFDGDGRVTTDFGGGADSATAVVIQADNKIVVAGRGLVGTVDAVVARYNVAGSLDLTYSGDGKANFDISNTTNNISDAKLQSDGKLVGVGEVTTNFAVYRVNTNGTLDTTFDSDGTATTDISGSDNALAVAIQSDGKIVAAGTANGSQDVALTRYNTNGTLDTTFDGDGKVLSSFNPAGNEGIQSIELQPDGKIIAGFFGVSTTGLLGLNAARYNANGSLDFGFGFGGGFATASIAANEQARSIALVDNKLIIVGDAADITVVQMSLTPAPSQSNDFDGDGFSDYVIFRPSTANWFVLRSSDQSVQILSFGANGDVPLDGDFDGDGRNDLAIYRPSASEWWHQKSSSGTTFATAFGTAGDKPVPGDYDKDGKTDIASWRPSTGNYFVVRSSDGFSSFFGFQFGANGDIPVGTAVFP